MKLHPLLLLLCLLALIGKLVFSISEHGNDSDVSSHVAYKGLSLQHYVAHKAGGGGGCFVSTNEILFWEKESTFGAPGWKVYDMAKDSIRDGSSLMDSVVQSEQFQKNITNDGAVVLGQGQELIVITKSGDWQHTVYRLNTNGPLFWW